MAVCIRELTAPQFARGGIGEQIHGGTRQRNTSIRGNNVTGDGAASAETQSDRHDRTFASRTNRHEITQQRAIKPFSFGDDVD